jgi:hypothetical protein
MSRKLESPKDGKSESPEEKRKLKVGNPKSENQEIIEQTKSETAKPSLTPIKNKQPLKIINRKPKSNWLIMLFLR